VHANTNKTIPIGKTGTIGFSSFCALQSQLHLQRSPASTPHPGAALLKSNPSAKSVPHRFSLLLFINFVM